MKICKRCEQEKSVPDEIGPGGAYVCFNCQRLRRNARTRELRRENPETRARHVAESREWRRRHPERAAAAQRRWREKVRADPERYQEWLDNNRIYHRIWRERQGIHVRTMSEAEYLERYGNGSGWKTALDPTPLVAQMAGWFDDEETVDHCTPEERELARTQQSLAAISGVPARTIGRVLNEGANISLRNADRLAVAIDVPLTLVYPEVS